MLQKFERRWAVQPALLIMDKFRDQMSAEVQENLEENRILVAVIPAGTTDQLQPLDLTLNKAAKSFLCDRFHHCYADEVKKQLQGVDDPTTDFMHIKVLTNVHYYQ